MKRYWLAWLNEIGKLSVVLFFARIAWASYYDTPSTPNDKLFGIIAGIFLSLAIMVFTDIPFSIWSIHKGTHKLLKKKQEEALDTASR